MRKLKSPWHLVAVVVAFALAPAAGVALAAGGGGASSGGGGAGGGGTSSAAINRDLASAWEKIELNNYRGAILLLQDVLAVESDNADALNLLGYSHRKLGNKDKALGYYTQALEIDPKHKGANEYLGELYLEMKDVAKAEERLAVLGSACAMKCEEYAELKAAIDAFKANEG